MRVTFKLNKFHQGMVADPEECDMSELAQLTEIENHLAVFCVATYGEGDPTDNAQEFYEFLQNGDDQLDGLQYTVGWLICAEICSKAKLVVC